MRFLLLLGGVLGVLGAHEALNCSEYGLEELDKVNVATGLFSTPPLTTNRTVYFNPCSPLAGVPECGENNYFCSIDKAEIDGRWVTTAVKLVGAVDAGMDASVFAYANEISVLYWGAEWGDFYLSGQLALECGNETRAYVERDVPGDMPSVRVVTPALCGANFPWPRCPVQRGFRVWRAFWLALFVVAALLVVYVSAALFVTSRSRALGPLAEEAGRALYELPMLVREGALNVYERVTGHGAGRNQI